MCIFCKIVNQEIPANVVYETSQVLAFRDVKPQAPIHILVIPKIHITSFQEINDHSINQQLVQAIQAIAVQEDLVNDGYRVVTNIGANGGQAVPHMHYHILAGRKMTWPPG